VARPRPLPSLALTFAVLACSKNAPDTAPPAEAAADRNPDFGEGDFEFVSTERNVEDERTNRGDDGPRYAEDYAITSSQAAKALAEETVADRLNPRQTWEASPLLPVAWPEPGKRVRVYFYPLAANPQSLESFELFSAQYAVTISLQDGAAEVEEIATKRLGTVKTERPSRLEREELELAEKALVHYLLSGNSDDGENAFWGYLKFMHEHPKLARDITGRAPKFVAWLKKKNDRTR
jgi:hypothetical protein